MTLSLSARNHLRSRHLARPVQQRIYLREKTFSMRQDGVFLERRFVHPPRMDIEQSWVPHRPEQMKTKTTWLLPRWRRYLPQRFLNRLLLAHSRMQPHKHKLLRDSLHTLPRFSPFFSRELRSHHRSDGGMIARCRGRMRTRRPGRSCHHRCESGIREAEID